MAKEAKKGMGFDVPVSEPKAEESTPVNGRDDTGRPYCGRHNVLMRATTTQGNVTHYRCPVESCDAREKRARPEIKVPTSPVLCSRSICGGAAMEVDEKKSALLRMSLVLVCPRCGQEVEVPKPGVKPTLRREPEPAGFDAR